MKSDVKAPRLSNREMGEQSTTQSLIKSGKFDGQVVEVTQRPGTVSDTFVCLLLFQCFLLTLFQTVGATFHTSTILAHGGRCQINILGLTNAIKNVFQVSMSIYC